MRIQDATIQVDFISTVPEGHDLLVGIFEGEVETSCVKDSLKTALKAADFTGKKGQCFSTWSLGDTPKRIMCIGLGKKDTLKKQNFKEIGAKCFVMGACKSEHLHVVLPTQGLENPDCAISCLAIGAHLRSWKFDQYKTKTEDSCQQKLKKISFVTPHPDETQKLFHEAKAINEGNFLTRHVVSEPPNVLYPESMAQCAKEQLEPLGLKVDVLGEAKMRELGFNALLGVGQGSARESQLIVIEWMNGPKDQAPIAIVGKGVTFDTGGISLKPRTNMDDMKYDMGGSGVVLGLLKALALRKAKVNVIGVMGMVENMPSGTAQRPADIVKSLSGQTIEILDTDAEGRLVLADALWYAQDRYKPQVMVDLATLTGAIGVALGHEYAGLFSNNDNLCEQLTEAGLSVDEKVWKFPMDSVFDKDIDSDVADVKNMGSGRGAGSITAAKFLERFVNNVPWAHLDIAGTTWDKKERTLTGKGATGFGVRLLNEWICKNYETA